MTIVQSLPIGSQVTIAKPVLERLFENLSESAYTLIGPRLDQEAIVYDIIDSMEDLPLGWSDDHGPGKYRIQHNAEAQYFSYVVGPTTWKKFLYPPALKLFTWSTSDGKSSITSGLVGSSVPPKNLAFIGVRGCDLAAVRILDRILLEGSYQDPNYRAVRESVFILAVNCGVPGKTCFCASMRTGPFCDSGFDLSLTELKQEFLLEIGSELGAEMLATCDWQPATARDLIEADNLREEASLNMGRFLDTSDLPDLLYNNLDSSHWDEVAKRCLACTNCTMVCPTCFCVDVQDSSDLLGETTERVRVWDSCFSSDYSYVHGGNTRPTIRSRYRQWLTHKLASWVDQFDSLGCTGCGRCIAWCPVGIDLTEEIAAIRLGGRS